MIIVVREADVLMAAYLAALAATERGSGEYVERNNHAQHFADAEAHRASHADGGRETRRAERLTGGRRQAHTL